MTIARCKRGNLWTARSVVVSALAGAFASVGVWAAEPESSPPPNVAAPAATPAESPPSANAAASVRADAPPGEANGSLEATGEAAPLPAGVMSPLNQLADNQAIPAVGSAAEVESSVAEQITRLEKSMQANEQRLAKLRDEIAHPMSEYRLAEAAFKVLEEQGAAIKAELSGYPADDPTEASVALQEQLTELTNKRRLARERFDLAIETRKTLQEQIAALESKQKQDRLALDRLTGATPAPVADAPAPNGNPVVASPVPVVAPAEAVPVAPSPAAVSAATAAAPPTAAIPAANASPNTTPAAMESPGAKAIRAELAKAETEAQAKQDEALQAEREAQSVSDRIAALDRDVALESKLLVGARKKSDIAYQTAQALEAEKEARRNAGAPESELAEMRANRRAAEKFFSAARAEVAERVDRLNELQTQRADLQREELTALSAARAKQEEAKDAAQVVVQLKNPFAMHNVLDWLLNHGVRVGVILLVMFVLRWVLALASLRIVNLMIRSGGRGTKQEREDRANTLFGVFRNAVSVTIVVSGAIMVCEELGIAVGPLMGGAAVLGLAVAFGAQNLIRDYFYGFVILLENQYKLNDVLKIGELSGQVEQITLRMTVLRDLEGNVHFVPNGKIDSVTNMTHGWSRAVVEIQIAYREDAERVMSLLLEIAAEMRRDVKFGEMILEDAEMLGVESFGDSAVAIRFMVKTRPLSRWAVKRELLRRIKRRFAEQAVEIPFPQRVIHYRPMAEGDGSLDLRDLDSPIGPRKMSA